MLNAEDFYATLVTATSRYFNDLRSDTTLQAQFLERVNDPDTGVLVVSPLTGTQ